ncbi:hypothetical protein D3C80_1325070 [compost metagenome]
MERSHSNCGTWSCPGEFTQATTGALLSTKLLISRAIGSTNSNSSRIVIATTASDRRPHSRFCSLISTGQVAITTIDAQANPRIKG